MDILPAGCLITPNRRRWKITYHPTIVSRCLRCWFWGWKRGFRRFFPHTAVFTATEYSLIWRMLDLLGFPGLELHLILGKMLETSFQFILLFATPSVPAPIAHWIAIAYWVGRVWSSVGRADSSGGCYV